MTTPSGQISLNDVNVELGKSGTTTIALGDSDVRSLAGVASGAISMNNLRGVSSIVNLTYTFSANTANASLNVTSISGYVAGKTNITITVNSGVYLYATSTSNAGLTLTGGTTGDTVTLVNNGYIMGMGGTGGRGDDTLYPQGNNGTAGGTALSLGFNTTINNTNASAYIGGGGGGGSGSDYKGGGGGGAGGGVGGYTKTGAVSPPGNYKAGGAGGSPGSSGSNGEYIAYSSKSNTLYIGSGGGGGRVFPGSGGTGGTPGNGHYGYGGGAGGGGGCGMYYDGAAGGSGSSVGGNMTPNGGGGGWGASGGKQTAGSIYVGGAGGKAVALNGKTVTWVAGNTTRVYGAVS